MNTTNLLTTANIVDLTGQRIDLSNWLGWAHWWEASLDMGSGIELDPLLWRVQMGG